MFVQHLGLYYKGPEILVGLQDYDYSLLIRFMEPWLYVCWNDISHGAFFYGRDNYDQLVKIAKLRLLGGLMHSKKPWTIFINSDNQHLSVAIDFVDKLLRYDHQESPLLKKQWHTHTFTQYEMQKAAGPLRSGEECKAIGTSSPCGGTVCLVTTNKHMELMTILCVFRQGS
ncbi:hypothetical protein QVD17_06506 [Tagetes erecta]|uniref:non-specific serine/threonine protein kinase n=1 Tax=Tagetes erecta TaxID=13708 RepID=A0AAD8LFQ8_TARER|nr:hypothetical protein QVD17_06506 [Tagetes erecta]